MDQLIVCRRCARKTLLSMLKSPVCRCNFNLNQIPEVREKFDEAELVKKTIREELAEIEAVAHPGINDGKGSVRQKGVEEADPKPKRKKRSWKTKKMIDIEEDSE